MTQAATNQGGFSFHVSNGLKISEIEFPSEGTILRGFLYFPESHAEQKEKPPVVIMAHGFSATIQMVADKYAEVFCHSGLAVLLYDHRNLGSSGGEPRQEINPWIQGRGYRDAMNFCEEKLGSLVDYERMALWGDSYSGAEAIVVGAIDKRAKVVVAQVPVCGAEAPKIEPSEANFKIIKEIFERGDVRGKPESANSMPVVSFDQSSVPSIIKPIQAFRWFIDYGGRPGSGWINRATRISPGTKVPFTPLLCAPFINSPILMMVARDDEIANANPHVARQVFELIPDTRKQWYEIAGGHFGLLYFPGEIFEEASRAQAKFFNEHLT